MFNCRERAKQLINFDGMNPWGKAMPTDIDAMIDVHGKLLVLFEVKYREKHVPEGQRIALENLVKIARAAKKHALAVVVEHSVDNPDEDIQLSGLPVREIYCTEEMEWRPPRQRLTAREIADCYIKHFGGTA